MTDYSFQENLKEEVWKNLQDKGRAVLAAGCGAGKTQMAIDLIKRHLDRGGGRVLVLTHGQKLLRQQTSEAFAKANLPFEHAEIGVKGQNPSAPIHIGLPHSISRNADYNDYALVVDDEAHHFYRGKMVQDILARNPDAKQLMLTASHGWFTKTHWPVTAMSMIELLDRGVIMGPLVEMASSGDDFRNYLNSEGELNKKFKFKHLYSDLEKVFLLLKKQFKGRNTKSMIACHNQATADSVVQFLQKHRVGAVLSTSDADPNSDEIARFQTDAECQVLVVVYRGILGFNMPELETIVDLSGSDNIDRIFQLVGRCVRAKEGKKPLYIKLAPKNHEDWARLTMCGVMWLSHPSNYALYDGKVGTIRMLLSRNEIAAVIKKKGSKKRHPAKKIKIPTFEEIADVFKKGETIVGDGYWTTFAEVRAQYDNGIHSKDYWTFERCKEDALKYSSISEWKRESGGAYGAAHRNGWVDKCCKHMGRSAARKPKDYWTLELCEKDASKYSTRAEWKRESSGAYSAAQANGWIGKCCKHMTKR